MINNEDSKSYIGTTIFWKKCLEGSDILQNVESIIHKVESSICLLTKLPQCGKYVEKLPLCGNYGNKTSTM